MIQSLKDFNCSQNDFALITLSNHSEIFKKQAVVGTNHPGIYVWKLKGKVIRVGKSESNVHERALQHIKHNTNGVMEGLKKSTDLSLDLYILQDTEKKYVLYSAEQFLEETLCPICKQGVRHTGATLKKIRNTINNILSHP